jgi:hypothetical protein
MKRPLEMHNVLHLGMITVHLKSLHILQYFDSLVLVSRHPIIDAEINGPISFSMPPILLTNALPLIFAFLDPPRVQLEVALELYTPSRCHRL